MATLTDILLVPGNRPRVISDCVTLIQEEVDSKGGLSGLAVKAAFAVVKAVKPGFINEAVDHMLDDFVKRLEPFWADAQAKNALVTLTYVRGDGTRSTETHRIDVVAKDGAYLIDSDRQAG